MFVLLLLLNFAALAEPGAPEPTAAEQAVEDALGVLVQGMIDLGWKEVGREAGGVRMRAATSGKLELLLAPTGRLEVPGKPAKQAEIVAALGFDPFAASSNVRPVDGPHPMAEPNPDATAVWVVHTTLHEQIQAWRQATIAAQRQAAPPPEPPPAE